MDERDYKAMNEELKQPSCLAAVMPSLPYEKVIKDRADYFRKIMHKYEAQRLEECLRTIKELIPPENWNVGNGA